jgi:hypothetical protein
MANAYVSSAGTAAYPGTVSAPTSLATAFSTAGAGDIVYIAPGTYRGTFTLGVSGSAGNTIQFIGDAGATQAISGISPGIVRITNIITDTAFPTNATMLTATSRSYWSFEGIYFDGYGTTVNQAALSLVTCTNFSFTKCTFANLRQVAVSMTTSAGVAVNASFSKCTFPSGTIAIAFGAPTHSGNYAVGLTITDCLAFNQLINMATTPSGSSNTNGGNVVIYNCTAFGSGTPLTLYSSNTATPSVVRNCILMAYNGFLNGGTTGSCDEDYNVVFGDYFNMNVGANTIRGGTIGLDFGYSALAGISAPSFFGPYLGSRAIASGVVSGAPATDIDGVPWYQTTPDRASYTYAGRNNVIRFFNPSDTNSITIAPNSTSQSIELYLGATGLTASTSGLSARYNRTRTASVSIPLVARTIAQAWTAGGFAEVDATNMPGVYRLDIPDAALASGADDVTIVVRGASGTNGAVMTVKLSSGGLTEAQTASAVWGADPSGYIAETDFGGVVNATRSLVGTIDTEIGDVASNVWDELRTNHTTVGSFGQYVNAELVTPVTSAALVRMGPFEVRADGLGASDPLDIQKGAQHGVDIQCVDNNGAGIDITSATVTAKVYNSGATLVDTYSCTATYAADGRATFTIDTTVTNTPGTYTATITRTTGASDTQIFGPLRIYVRDI